MTPCLLLDMAGGALDLVPKIAETKDIAMTSLTSPMVGPELIDSVEKTLLVHDDANLHQREHLRTMCGLT